MAELTFTGERFLPDCRGEIWLEHWHRYHFAASLASGLRVLDVASGEGYGSALLAAAASAVVGVDASNDAISHARTIYAYLDNLKFVAGDCAALPFADGAFDLVVSFETIEHISAQREFLAEVRRVLAPDGMLLLSSPNKAEYSDRRQYANPFHVAELYRDELKALLADYFSDTAWYGQGVGFCSTIATLHPAPSVVPLRGELVGLETATAGAADPSGNREPLYYLVGCAQSPVPLTRLRQAFSVLGDPDDIIYRDYQDTYRKFVAASEAVTTFRAREAALETDRSAVRDAARTDIEFIQRQLGAAEIQRDAARSQTEDLRGEIDRLRAEIDALRTLTARLGGTVHAAQQATLKLTASLHEANARYTAELAATQRAAEELAATLAAEHLKTRDETARQSAATVVLEAQATAQAAELNRRLGWRWRLRAPWRRA